MYMIRRFTTHMILFALVGLLISCGTTNKEAADKKEESTTVRGVWSQAQANEWYKKWDWLVGANFNPSSAINQLETWQAESFDVEAIDQELGWAESIGMNAMRVYLHHVAWKQNPTAFKERMNTYLTIADKHGIATLFVFFDDCWNDTYAAGKQPDPKPGIHNSGWVQDPGPLLFEQPEIIDSLEIYVKDVMSAFAYDKRIILWDLYNEPGNSGYGNKSMPLLQKVFQWGREVNPSQPLSVGVWKFELTDLNKYQVENSDVITYHNYQTLEEHKAMIDTLKTLGRPMICTEYMARTRNSTFEDILPLLKENNIGAINWGLVSGKSNTIYAWNTPIPSGEEPEIWFHDIFRKDGSVYSEQEVALIKKLTSE